MCKTSRREKRMLARIANLGADDKLLSQMAEALLLRYYVKSAIPYLIPQCESENAVVRYRAVWVLGYSQSAEAFDSIFRLCEDPDERVRYDRAQKS